MPARPPPPKVIATEADQRRHLKTIVSLTGYSFVAPTGPNFTTTVGQYVAPPGDVVASKRPALHGPNIYCQKQNCAVLWSS